MRKLSLRATLAIGGLALVFIALPLFRLAFRAKVADATGEGAPVTAVRPERRDISDSLTYAGLLKPEATITILPKIAGKVDRLLVREGGYVRKDDLIAVIDDEVVQLQARQAKAGFEAAQAQADKALRGVRPQELENAKASLSQATEDLAAAESTFERTKKLYEAGTVSKSKYEEADNAMRGARTQLENAKRSVSLMEEGASKEDQRMASSQAEAMRAQYDLALLQAEYAQVRSPASGRVVKVMVEAGNMVAPTMPLVVIAQDAAMTAQVAVPERHYGRFLAHRGAIPAFITPIAFSERKPFTGVVASVSQAVDPQSRSFLVEVSVDNSEGLLRSGMYVDVALSLDTAKGALALPERAIIRKSGSTYVYVIGPVPAPAQGKKPKKPAATPDPAVGAVSLVEVKTGLSGDGYVQILSGLAGTESVVVEGNAFLEDGQTVRVVEAE